MNAKAASNSPRCSIQALNNDHGTNLHLNHRCLPPVLADHSTRHLDCSCCVLHKRVLYSCVELSRRREPALRPAEEPVPLARFPRLRRLSKPHPFSTYWRASRARTSQTYRLHKHIIRALFPLCFPFRFRQTSPSARPTS